MHPNRGRVYYYVYLVGSVFYVFKRSNRYLSYLTGKFSSALVVLIYNKDFFGFCER